MDDTTSSKLRLAFPPEAIRQRQGPGGRSFSYISGADVISRVIDATNNEFDFRIMELTNMGSFFLAKVSLTIPGLGTREGIGVQGNVEANEDSIKGAITDAFKIAAKMFGVGLGMWGETAAAISTGGEMPRATLQVNQSPPAVRDPGAPASEKQIYKIRAMIAERGGNPQIIDGTNVTKGKAHEWIDGMVNGVLPPELFAPAPKIQEQSAPDPSAYASRLQRLSRSNNWADVWLAEVNTLREASDKPNPDMADLEWKFIELTKVCPMPGDLDMIYDWSIENGMPDNSPLARAITTRFDQLMSDKGKF